MMNQGDFRQLLGTDLPIIQAPMAGVQGSALAIAVSEAGGLGSLPCAMLGMDDIVAEINTIKRATDRPFNLNFFCHKQPDYSEKQHQAWHTLLAPYFAEFGINPHQLATRSSRQPFSHDMADAIEPFRPEIISFHFGLPEPTLLARVKGWGTRIISSATTLAEARWLAARGVDGIIAQGLEAGGHRGMFLSDDVSTQVGLFPLVRQIVEEVPVPVIAAGGIADSRGVQAALMLGASAVQVGTAYLLCPEANTSSLHRQALKAESAEVTALTTLFSGRPARGIVNRVMRELDCLHPAAPDFPYASIAMTALRTAAEQQGTADFSPLWCGQNASGCREIAAGELTRQLAAAGP